MHEKICIALSFTLLPLFFSPICRFLSYHKLLIKKSRYKEISLRAKPNTDLSVLEIENLWPLDPYSQQFWPCVIFKTRRMTESLRPLICNKKKTTRSIKCRKWVDIGDYPNNHIKGKIKWYCKHQQKKENLPNLIKSLSRTNKEWTLEIDPLRRSRS